MTDENKCFKCGSNNVQTFKGIKECENCHTLLEIKYDLTIPIKIKINDKIKDIKCQVGNVLYRASLIFENLEHLHIIIGNGHHIAQKISKDAQDLFEERLIKKEK